MLNRRSKLVIWFMFPFQRLRRSQKGPEVPLGRRLRLASPQREPQQQELQQREPQQRELLQEGPRQRSHFLLLLAVVEELRQRSHLLLLAVAVELLLLPLYNLNVRIKNPSY